MTFICLHIVGVESYCFTWSHSVPHTDSVGIVRTSDRPVAETCTWPSITQHSQETDIRAPGAIRIRNPRMPATVDPRLRKRGHRRQLSCDTLSRHADSFRPTTLSPVPSFARSWLLSWCVTHSHTHTHGCMMVENTTGQSAEPRRFLLQIIHKELH